MSSMLDVPVLRIIQCASPDALSVAEYYSNELVGYVRRVMEVIPVSVFKILTNIVVIKERRLKPLPVKVEVDLTKDYAQMDERYELAKLTHQVSVFTEGILAMEKTLLGIIQVDPRGILEDGLRKEVRKDVYLVLLLLPTTNRTFCAIRSAHRSLQLVRQISHAMNTVLTFTSNAPPSETHAACLRAFSALSNRVNGYRLAIEYIQDYVDIAGLELWGGEMQVRMLKTLSLGTKAVQARTSVQDALPP